MSVERQSGPRHPRNPWYGFLYAAILLAGAGAGFVMFALGWREALRFDMYGQRTEGFVLVTPFLSAGFGVFVLVRAVLAVAPWIRHRSATPRAARLVELAQDRAKSRPVIAQALVYGVLALAGFILLFGFARADTVFGLATLAQMEALLLFVAILCLKNSFQAIWANRHLGSLGIRSGEDR